MKITFTDSTTRHCGGCTSCCKLLPVKEIGKPANTRCGYQRTGKGCSIFDKRPFSCRVWNCAWIQGDDTEELRRPDRSHYVIDILPDYVTLQFESQPDVKIPVVQIWLDPNYPDAHRDPALRAYLMRRGAEGMMAIVRTSSSDAFVICPPNMSHDGKWHEERSGMSDKEHSLADFLQTFGGA